MTRTAILTITCPWCGGRVEGVTSTAREQRIPCPYCRTDLHVPRVGTELRERVIERVIEREVPPKEPEPSLFGTVITLVLGLIVLLVFAAIHCSSAAERTGAVDTYQQQRLQREACQQQCEASCPAVETTRYDDHGFERARQDASRAICSGECTLKCFER